MRWIRLILLFVRGVEVEPCWLERFASFAVLFALSFLSLTILRDTKPLPKASQTHMTSLRRRVSENEEEQSGGGS